MSREIKGIVIDGGSFGGEPVVIAGETVLAGTGTVRATETGSPWIVSARIEGHFDVSGNVRVGPNTDLSPFMKKENDMEETVDLSEEEAENSAGLSM